MITTKKDLSYKGRSERLKLELLQSVKNITEDLRREKIGVTLTTENDSLYLRFKDPTGKRRKISPPSISLSRSGLESARKMAYQIRQAINNHIYTDDWLRDVIYGEGDKPIALTWGFVADNWRDAWLKSREGAKTSDRQKHRTLKGYESQLKLAGDVGRDELLSKKLITELLTRQKEGTDKRFRLREVLSVICTLYGLEYNFKNIGKRPAPKARELPSDDEIVSMWASFDTITKSKMSDQSLVKCYQWYFAVLATYGLRPQELFAIDLRRSFKPETNYWISLDEKLTDGLKTGDRWIAPLYPEWVGLFGIPSVQIRTNWRGSMDVQTWAASVGVYFAKHKIGVKPYDLRHAYAIRARKAGLSLDDRADLLGHDTTTHSKQYQRWISIEDRIASIAMALDRNKQNISDQQID
jgi:integrase